MKKLNCYEKSLETRLRNVNGKTVLINSQNGKCYQINPIGKVIWRGIGKEYQIIELLRKSDVKLPNNLDEIEKDVELFLDFLLKENLINESE